MTRWMQARPLVLSSCTPLLIQGLFPQIGSPECGFKYYRPDYITLAPTTSATCILVLPLLLLLFLVLRWFHFCDSNHFHHRKDYLRLLQVTSCGLSCCILAPALVWIQCYCHFTLQVTLTAAQMRERRPPTSIRLQVKNEASFSKRRLTSRTR